MRPDRPSLWKSHRKWLECALKFSGQVSGDHQGGASNVSQVDVESDTAPVVWLFGGRAQKRNNGLCQNFHLGESYPSSYHLNARLLSFFLYVSGAFWAAAVHCNLQQVSLSKSNCRPFKRITRDFSNLSSHSATIPASGFYSQKLWGLVRTGTLCWVARYGAETPSSSQETSKGEITLLIFNHRRWVWNPLCLPILSV